MKMYVKRSLEYALNEILENIRQKNKACVYLMISSHIGKIPNIFNDTVINMDNYTPIKQNQNYDNCLF